MSVVVRTTHVIPTAAVGDDGGDAAGAIAPVNRGGEFRGAAERIGIGEGGDGLRRAAAFRENGRAVRGGEGGIIDRGRRSPDVFRSAVVQNVERDVRRSV